MRFIPPCSSVIAKTSPTGPEWLPEVKFDGWRVQIHRRPDDVVKLFSRNGRDITDRFPTLTEDEPIIALDISGYLEDAGAKVMVTTSLKDSVAKVSEPAIQVAIVDHRSARKPPAKYAPSWTSVAYPSSSTPVSVIFRNRASTG